MTDSCPQCGYIHPPIIPGEKCPLSREKSFDGDFIDTSAFINQVKNIVVSRIQTKKIKNHKKLFSAIVMEIFKFLEGYKEE
jgi:hypothetical protein